MSLLDESEVLLAVVEAGSLLGASRHLGRSVSAVSRTLDALEARVGATLLLRSPKGVRLTNEGELFRRQAEALLDAASTALASVRPDGLAGVLTVSASSALGLSWVNRQVHAFLRTWPHARVNLRLEDRLVDVVAEGVDVAVRAGAPPDDEQRLSAARLGTLPRVLVGVPNGELLRTPADLTRVAVVTSNRDGVTGWVLRRGDEEVRIERPARFWTSGLHAVLDAVRAGVGVGMVTEPLVRADLATGRLVRVLPEWEAPPAPVWVIYRRELRKSRLVGAFVEHLRGADLLDAVGLGGE